MISLVAAIGLAGCGEDELNETVDTGTLLAFVKDTNTPSQGVTLHGLLDSERTGIVRFGTQEKIPLYFVSKDGLTPPYHVTKAIEYLEARLGDIFSDIHLVQEDLTQYKSSHGFYPNGQYDETEFTNRHGITNGIAIAIDTNYEAGSTHGRCANASDGPYEGSLSFRVEPSTHTYSEYTFTWANIGTNCTDVDYTQLVMHELSHSLGMYDHIQPYMQPWSKTAMDMLATLYGNEPGTPFNELTPYQ